MENQITLSDLAILKNIVDMACTRGAFRAIEMTEVGTIYTKLSVFLDNMAAQAQAAQASETAVVQDPAPAVLEPTGE
jgi:hypothetical protein